MRKFGLVSMLFVFSLLVVGITGCGDDGGSTKSKADNVAQEVTFVVDGVTYAVDAADPIIKILEEKYGIKLNQEIAEKGASGAKKAAEGLGFVGAIVNAIPGGQPVAGAILALSTLAGGIGTFLENRKKKQAQNLALEINDEKVQTREALKTSLMAVREAKINDIPAAEVGMTIVDAARKNGCADLVEGAYQEAKMVDAVVVDEKAA
jgi:hypothetical protein